MTLPPMLVLALLASPPAGSSSATDESSCAACHMGLAGEAVSDPHIVDWSNSPHREHGVGCEGCHGGNPRAFDQYRAHQGILPSAHEESRTHWSNVPETCGRCHVAGFSAYSQSSHWRLLRQGNEDSPSCTTCHGGVAALALGRGLQAHCSHCHGADAEFPMTEALATGSAALQRFRETARVRRKVRNLIERQRDEALRRDLEKAFFEAESDWQAAIVAGHRFDFDEMSARVDDASGAFDRLHQAIHRLD